MPKDTKWAKEDQGGMRINLVETLGNMNWIREKYMAGPKKTQQAQVKW